VGFKPATTGIEAKEHLRKKDAQRKLSKTSLRSSNCTKMIKTQLWYDPSV